MKSTKKLIVSLFNLVLAFTILCFVGVAPVLSAPLSLAVMVLLNNIPASISSAFSGFITNGSEFYGKELEDIILRPTFVGTLPKEMGIRIILSVKSTVKLTFFGPMSKILKAYADGFQGGTASTKKQKKLTLAEFKAEAEYSKQTYKLMVLENITQRGGNVQNDISGTSVFQAEVSLFMGGIKEDVRRIFWLGDTTKKTLNASPAYYTVTGDVNYNVINGIWAAIKGSAALSPTADQIKRIAITNSAVAQVATHTLTGTSGTANVGINGANYLATFTTDLTTSAANFVTSHAATLLTIGITATSSGADIILTATLAGQPFSSLVAAVNVSGNLAGTLAQTTANTLPAALTTDEAKDTFKSVYTGSNKLLKDLVAKKLARLYVTDTIIENYQASLEATGTEASHKALVDGIDRYTWRGIPIIPMDIDHHLTNDFIEPYPHRVILTVPDNLVLVLNGLADDSEVKFWFNPDENKNRQRAQFEFGADFVLPEFMTVAY